MNLTNLNTAVYSKLSGGTALITALGGTAIYYELAPDGKALPYVVCSVPSRVDLNDNPNRTQSALVYIRAYASTPIQANAIDAEVDALMHGGTLSVTGATNFWCMREDSFSLVEVDDAKRKVYLSGAQYRIMLDIQ